MKLVVLGSGTSVPHPQRASPAFWLETETGSILLDCSADAPHRMAAEHLDWPNLDAIWISHLHLDHCGGLPPLLFGLKWAPQTRTRKKPLKIFGCEGVERWLKAIDDANDYTLLKQPFPIELHEPVQTEGFAMLASLKAQTFSTPHTRESLALRLTDQHNATLIYTSDTGYSEDLAHFARGADLLILECSFQRDKPTPRHLGFCRGDASGGNIQATQTSFDASLSGMGRHRHRSPGPATVARENHSRARRIAIGNQRLIHRMVRITNGVRNPSTRLIVLGIMIFLNAPMGSAQGNLRKGDPLLESGRAEKLLAPGASHEIKIVSYNIRWRSGDELQQIARWLKSPDVATAPAIIGLQEVDRAKKRSSHENHAKALAQSLGMYYAWAAPEPARQNKKSEEETGVVILSPYPMEEITRLVLTNAGPGDRSRVAVGATIKIGKRSVRVYSVHAETRLTMSQKIEQFRVVLDDLAKFPKTIPAIVLGDFNSWELPTIEAVRKLFTNAGFTTPLPDDESTFAKNAVFFDLNLKLDWIWVRGLTPRSYGIDRKLKVSDHFPLWTVVTLDDPASRP